MKKTLFTLFAAAVLLCSCSNPYDNNPVCKAIAEYAMKPYGDVEYKASFVSLEKIDSTTLETEFEHRIKLFERRMEVNGNLLEKYVKENKRKNAQIKAEAVEHDKAVLDSLSALKGEMAANLGCTVYYDYIFTATINVGGKLMELKDCYACLSPDNEVFAVSKDRKDLHKSTGRVIPGYLDIISSATGEEEDIQQ